MESLWLKKDWTRSFCLVTLEWMRYSRSWKKLVLIRVGVEKSVMNAETGWIEAKLNFEVSTENFLSYNYYVWPQGFFVALVPKLDFNQINRRSMGWCDSSEPISQFIQSFIIPFSISRCPAFNHRWPNHHDNLYFIHSSFQILKLHSISLFHIPHDISRKSCHSSFPQNCSGFTSW